MRLLRDLRETTKLLILLEIVNNRPRALNSIAARLEITVQGASDYVRTMAQEDLVKKIGGEYRATKKGVELLENRMFELKEFVDSSIKQLEIIDICGAIAGNNIRKDEEVGLFMEEGVLVAYSGKDSPSKDMQCLMLSPERILPSGTQAVLWHSNQGRLPFSNFPLYRKVDRVRLLSKMLGRP